MNQPLFDPVRRSPKRRHHHEHRPVPPTPRQRRLVIEGPKPEPCGACGCIPRPNGFCSSRCV